MGHAVPVIPNRQAECQGLGRAPSLSCSFRKAQKSTAQPTGRSASASSPSGAGHPGGRSSLAGTFCPALQWLGSWGASCRGMWGQAMSTAKVHVSGQPPASLWPRAAHALGLMSVNPGGRGGGDMSPGHCPQPALELECPFSLFCGYLLRVAASFSKGNFCSMIPSALLCFLFSCQHLRILHVCVPAPAWNFCPQGAIIISHMGQVGTWEGLSVVTQQ